MNRISSSETTEHASLRSAVSLKDAVAVDSVFLFENSSSFVEELLREQSASNCRLFALCPCETELIMSADRADMEIIQIEAEEIAPAVSETDIIFAANPNRSNGNSFSLAELKSLSAKVPRGLLIIDEYYFDFLRITAAPALDELNNIIALRYFNNWGGLSKKDHGYALMSLALAKRFDLQSFKSLMTRNSARICYEQFGRSQERNNQLKRIQSGSLKLAREITDIGLQCHLTSADFLIVEVGSAKIAAALQRKSQLSVETIFNRDKPTNLLRCQVTLTEADEELIEIFKQISKLNNKSAKRKIRARESLESLEVVP